MAKDSAILESGNPDHVHALETRVRKLRSRLRFVLVGLIGVIVVLTCTGAFVVESLLTEVQQQQHELAQRAMMDTPLNDGQPPGPPAQSVAGQDP